MMKIRATNPPAKFASVEHAQRAIKRMDRWYSAIHRATGDAKCKGKRYRRSPKPPTHIANIEHADWRRAEEVFHFHPGRADLINRARR